MKEAKDKGLDFIQFIGKTRAKTSIQPRSQLTPEAIHSLSDYLPLLEKKYNGLPKYLWSNEKGNGHITNEGLNKKLKRILAKANIETYGKQVKFHEIRKFMYSLLQAKIRRGSISNSLNVISNTSISNNNTNTITNTIDNYLHLRQTIVVNPMVKKVFSHLRPVEPIKNG